MIANKAISPEEAAEIQKAYDCLSLKPCHNQYNKYGYYLKDAEQMKDQVEERLKFVTSGVKPRKNKEAMAEVLDELKKEGLYYGAKVQVTKEAGAEADADQETDEEDAPKKSKKDKKEKKDKKDKKRKRSEVSDDEEEPEAAKPKKKSKKA